MLLIIGLGNPGIKYNSTRHNIGFRIIDAFAKENNVPEFRLSKKHNALISKFIINRNKIILAKPQTFMNNSGKAVKSMIDYLSLTTNNIIVVHDDIDIKIGEIKISKNRGSAGHKGVQSIIDEIKTKDFTRVRAGIGENSKLKTQISRLQRLQCGQARPQLKTESLEKFVLKKFTTDEEKILENVIAQSCDEILKQIKNGSGH